MVSNIFLTFVSTDNLECVAKFCFACVLIKPIFEFSTKEKRPETGISRNRSFSDLGLSTGPIHYAVIILRHIDKMESKIILSNMCVFLPDVWQLSSRKRANIGFSRVLISIFHQIVANLP